MKKPRASIVACRIVVMIMTISLCAFATTRTWTGSVSSNMNVVTNYDPSTGTLDPADILIFNNTSSQPASASADLQVDSICITSGYTGNWSINGRTLTLGKGLSDDGAGGTRDYGNGITINGASGMLHIGSTVGTVTATNCALQFTGSGQTFAYNSAVAPIFRSLAVADNAGLTTSGTVLTFKGTGTLFTLGNSARLTNNSTIWFVSMATATPFSLGSGYTWNGTGGDVSIATGLPDLIITLPELHYSGNGIFYIRDVYAAASSTTFNFNGPIDLGPLATLHLYVVGPGSGLTRFNTNGFPIICNSLYTGSNSTETRQFEINYGSSSITCGGYALGPLNKAGVAQTINLQNSQWTCTGNWTFGSNHTVNPGTSTITLTGTSTVTSAGKSFNNLTINSGSGTVTLADNLTLSDNGAFTVSSGSFNDGGKTVSVGKDVSVNTTGTFTASGSWTQRGDGNWTYANNGTYSVSNQNAILQGTGVLSIVKPSTRINSMTCSNGGKTTTWSSSSSGSSGSRTISIGSGTFTIGTAQYYLGSSTGPWIPYTLAEGYTINGSEKLSININGAITCNAGGITLSGASQGIEFVKQAGASTLNFDGDVVLAGTGALRIQLNYGSGLFTVNTNDHAFSTNGPFYIGTSTTSPMIINFGCSNAACGTFSDILNGAGGTTFNLGTSQWTCSGNWSFGSNHTISWENNSKITFPSGSHTITTAGKPMPQVVFQGNATWVGGSTINRLQVGPGITSAFQPASTYTIQNISAGDWQGAQGNLARFQSSTTGQRYNIAMPANTVLNNYCRFQDLNLTAGQIVANSVTCQDGGNNQGISWVTEADYQVTASMTNGSVTLSPPGGTYYNGMSVTFTAVPNTGFSFTGWEGDLAGAQNPKTITITGDMTVTAKSELGDFQPPNTCGADQNLLVSGRILCSEMKIKNWLFRQATPPDYVFSKTYPLLDLGEVELFIRKNNHLPEVPSAKDMQESGLDLTKFNMTLLKKIEELTLYAIEQEKTLGSQSGSIDKAQKEMVELRKKVENIEKLRKK